MSYFHNRWVFALAACLSAIVTLSIWFSLVGILSQVKSPNSGSGLRDISWIVSLSASLAALFCWPKKTIRTRHRMTLASALTVMLAFVFTGWGLKLVNVDFYLLDAFVYGFVLAIFGSFVSLGIPYLIAFCVSQFFVDPSAPKTKYFFNEFID